ncbi:MAG: lipoprotein-releasing ABC transporter permease subunit [Alphaproteobacteria bacterium]
MIFSRFERTVAFRYLRPRRAQGFISVIAAFSLLGIALGVATLIIVMSVMNGFRQELIGRILGVNGHLGVYALEGTLSDYDALAQRLRALPGVMAVAPIVEGQVMVTANGAATGALVRGMTPEDLAARHVIADKIMQGTLKDFEGDDAAVIGERLARRLGVKLGDSITLISPQGNTTAFGTVPRLKAYKVVAIFNIGMYEYDSAFVYLPLPAAQLYFRMPEAVSGLEILAGNPEHVDALRRTVIGVTGANYRLYDWRQANAGFFNALEVERNVMFLILTLIILVAAFNIISSLIMLVKEKGRAIAILRTMGATRAMIMRIFFLSGASVGVIGTLAGFVLGLAFCRNIETIRHWLESLTKRELFAAEIYYLSRLPAEIDPVEVMWVVLMALGLSFAATLYPSWRASRLDPVEALRYE